MGPDYLVSKATLTKSVDCKITSTIVKKDIHVLVDYIN